MASYSPSREIYDPFRQKWVVKTPEEEVRQALLEAMCIQLDYPKGLIAIEHQVGRHSVGNSRRRFDILCYSPNGKPLLLIECKASILNKEAEEQLIGYNAAIQAPFLALASQKTVRMGFFSQSSAQWVFQEGFASYTVLMRRLHG